MFQTKYTHFSFQKKGIKASQICTILLFFIFFKLFYGFYHKKMLKAELLNLHFSTRRCILKKGTGSAGKKPASRRRRDDFCPPEQIRKI